MKNKFVTIAITFMLTLGLSISFQNLLAAWVTPTFDPPNQSISRPIDTGNAGQSKDAGLVLNHLNTNAVGLLVEHGDLEVGDGDMKVDGTGNSHFMGRLGIGTNAPNQALEIVHDGNAHNYIGLTDNISGRSYILRNGASSNDGKFDITDSGSGARLTIDTNGYVGIGDTNPTEVLDVNGKIRMRTQTEVSDADDIVATKKYVDDNGGGWDSSGDV